MASNTLPVALAKTNGKIRLEINKDQLESFMNACGLFRGDFLRTLKRSATDHREGKVSKRKNLSELMD